MSDLQIGLIIVGLVLILVVVVFNWWQDWRARAQIRQHFPEDSKDVLLGSAPAPERHEPTVGAAPAADITETADIDAQCETVIDISFAQPVQAEPLAQALQPLLQNAAKPIRLFAVHAGGALSSHLHQGESYVSVQLAVLMANRSGALSAIAWSSIWTQAQAVAARFDGVVEGLDQDQVLQQATALDTLCADLDATVNLHLRLSQPMPLPELQVLVHEVGFIPQAQQRVWVGEDGQACFTLQCNGRAWEDHPKSSRVERLDLVLDVPNSPTDTQAFSRMAEVGRTLASRMDATLLDDQGRPLAAETDATVDQQLTQLYQRLEAAGFIPGDARCARVFA